MLFWISGYAFAYGNDCDADASNPFIGTACFWFMTGKVGEGFENHVQPNATLFPEQIPFQSADESSPYAGWFFQWAFCATASTIVSGAVAERIVFKLYIIITIFLTGFIYPVVVHWGWASDGWACAWRSKPSDETDLLLFDVGVVDFAGSGIVHMVGGVAAFVAAYMIGPRHGRFVKHFKLDGHVYARTRDQPLIQDTQIQWMEVKQSEVRG